MKVERRTQVNPFVPREVLVTITSEDELKMLKEVSDHLSTNTLHNDVTSGAADFAVELLEEIYDGVKDL